jgi:hypothetical protein
MAVKAEDDAEGKHDSDYEPASQRLMSTPAELVDSMQGIEGKDDWILPNKQQTSETSGNVQGYLNGTLFYVNSFLIIF